jgi:hypothetical protein
MRRIPRPPNLIGKVDWRHCKSVKRKLSILSKQDFKGESIELT